MKSKQVVFISYSFGFPNGMASTQRARLLAKGLVENGITATFLCVKVIARPPVENIDVKGFYQGVSFEYTPGTTVRPESFMKRRWLELRGLTVALVRLITLKVKDEIYCIYLYGNEKLTPMGCIYRILAVLLRIPLLVELNEIPWSLKDKPTFLEKKVSPLIGATGATVISDFLHNWVLAESNRLSKQVTILHIPIVVDPQEVRVNHSILAKDDPKFLFAGSPVYKETIRFILNSMGFVLCQYPFCQLIITGIKENNPQGNWIQSERIDQDLRDNLTIAGYVSRNDLLALYEESTALLIPLFDDIISKARFPTKLGEYLLSGRPVITSDVGEITKYLTNNWNAFVCEPGDPKAFAELIIKTLEDPTQAAKIGQRGRDQALECFDYSIWVRRLSEFILALDKQQIYKD